MSIAALSSTQICRLDRRTLARLPPPHTDTPQPRARPILHHTSPSYTLPSAIANYRSRRPLGLHPFVVRQFPSPAATSLPPAPFFFSSLLRSPPASLPTTTSGSAIPGMSYYESPSWSAGGRQPSWEQQPPPSRSGTTSALDKWTRPASDGNLQTGASSTVSRDDSQAFLAQIEGTSVVYNP